MIEGKRNRLQIKRNRIVFRVLKRLNSTSRRRFVNQRTGGSRMDRTSRSLRHSSTIENSKFPLEDERSRVPLDF